MPQKLFSTDAFRAAVKLGERPDGTVFRFSTAEPETVATRTKRFVFSDGSVDHSDDVINPKGWNLAVFNKNPVALFSHMSWDPPIGRASGVGVVGDKLVGDIEFATAETYDFADTIYRLVDGGFLKAVSVGFKPDDWSFSSDKDRPYGIDFNKQTLLEISICPVPCNPNALSEARSAGVDVRPLVLWAERVLDTGDMEFMPRKDLEDLRSQAGGVRVSYYLQSDGATAKQAEAARTEMARWQSDPSSALLLPKGITLHPMTAGPSTKSGDWKCGAARDLGLDESDGWDGGAAEASIFEHAGGDEFDPAKARAGFLAYDASAPKLRGSYKLPFAHAVGGELKAVKGGIRAAASRLPQTDIPDAVKTSAQSVIDHYEKSFGMKAMGEGTGSGGGDLVGTAIGNCGRAADETCGMKDPQECMVHAVPVDKQFKAGRRVSAATKAKLQEAMDHHAAGMKCIESVMDGDTEDPIDEPPGGESGPGPAPAPETPPDPLIDLSPEQRRLREARALKASLTPND